MRTIIIIVTVLIVFVIAIPISFRIRKDIKKKLAFANTYAIQNVSSGLCVRPYNAGYKNGNNIISYPHKEWECVTWEMIALGENTFLLKNIFTEKTFQPKSEPEAGVGSQQSMGGTQLQYWEFLKQTDETYLIWLKGTDLYLTASSAKENSPIVLMTKQRTLTQIWKLVRQTPWI